MGAGWSRGLMEHPSNVSFSRIESLVSWQASPVFIVPIQYVLMEAFSQKSTHLTKYTKYSGTKACTRTRAQNTNKEPAKTGSSCVEGAVIKSF